MYRLVFKCMNLTKSNLDILLTLKVTEVLFLFSCCLRDRSDCYLSMDKTKDYGSTQVLLYNLSIRLRRHSSCEKGKFVKKKNLTS